MARSTRDTAIELCLLRRDEVPRVISCASVEKELRVCAVRSTLERNRWNISKILMNAAVLDHVKPKDSPRSLRGLTEQQLLATPESDYMSGAQLAFFRTKLELMRDEILAHAQQAADELREEVTVLADPADRATIEEEHNLEQYTRERERKFLKSVAQAIARIDTGDYGWCEETGDPIGIARLLASPTANLTVEAQERREVRERMFGA
jgi:DnaK suppressor protein